MSVGPANEDDREQVDKLAREIQQATGENVELAYVDQGYTGERAAAEAQEHGILLEVVKREDAKRGFVLLPRRWLEHVMNSVRNALGMRKTEVAREPRRP